MKLAKRWISTVVAVALTVTSVIMTPGIRVQAQDVTNHGTDRSKLVSKEEVNNTPPADYTIDSSTQAKAKDGVYSKYFLKEDIQTVKINIEENNLNYLLQNANDEPYVMTTDVTIGDQTLGYAGLKTKGNYTRNATYESSSDRFSFTINFGKYIKKANYGAKQNFFGCSKISFNNFYFDRTMLKEYNALRLMGEMGLPTPQYGLARLYINNQYYGIYAMVEAFDDAILKRYMNSGDVSSYMVKPSDTHLIYNTANDTYKDAQTGEFTAQSLADAGALTVDENGVYSVDNDFAINSSDLWEYDDDTLQDVGDMIPTVLNWQEKLTLLSEGKNFSGQALSSVNSNEYIELLGSVIDIDEALRYFATHSFIIQMDNMFTTFQNFGLYVDADGKSMMVPWDYDLGWGCYRTPYTSQDIANWNLDKLYTPDEPGLGYDTMTPEQIYKDFPIFNVIYQNTSLREKMHTYMEDCSKITALGGTTSDNRTFAAGRYAETIDILRQKIAADNTALADNVYYLNSDVDNKVGTQPSDATRGIPNLKKIIAMRAVGVWLQTQKVSSTATGYGCDMGTVGNAGTGRYTTDGILTAIDANTGIFASASYASTGGSSGPGGFGRNQVGPSFTVTKAATTDSAYVKVSEAIEGEAVLYKISNTKAPSGSYTVYVPVSSDWESASMFSYNASTGVLTDLNAKKQDNLCVAQTTDLSYLVVTNGKLKAQEDQQAAATTQPTDSSATATSTASTDSSKTTKVSKPKKTSIKSVKNSAKKTITVKWKKVSGASGYVIEYATNKSFKKAKKVTVKKAGTVKKVIKKLKKGKRYYVRIRVYKTVSGKKYYSGWSAKKSVKIKK